MIGVTNRKTSRTIERELRREFPNIENTIVEDAAFAILNAVGRRSIKGKIVVLIGAGSIGAIGFAVLRLMRLAEMDTIGLLCRCNDGCGIIGEDDGVHSLEYDSAKKMQLPLAIDCSIINSADVIIDAIFDGKPMNDNYDFVSDIIERSNACSAYRIAINIPSGMDEETGATSGTVFNANETIALHCVKRGLLLTDNREAVGKLNVCRILPFTDDKFLSLTHEMLIDEGFVRSLLPNRKLVSNKGTYGRSLIVAGSNGMNGAAVMAASAALRTGSGLVNAYVPEGIVHAFDVRPEIMVNADDGMTDSLNVLIHKANAIGVGCGSGKDAHIGQKLMLIIESGKPCVIDADGLNNLTAEHVIKLHENCVLTPHPGEMARLIGVGIHDVLKDRVAVARDYARKNNCVLLLKSSVTVIASPSGIIRYNISGNPGLAKGGSGDVLTGIITALLAQGLKPFDAASVGAFLLGVSADKALELLKNRMLTACDIIDAISLFNR